jgi:hypothetical protein
MVAPFRLLLSSLAGRLGAGSPRTRAPGSGSTVALVTALRRSGRLLGFRRLPHQRLELLVRPGLPRPRLLAALPRPCRSRVPLSPSALVTGSSGIRSQAQQSRSRRGGLPLLLPLGR